MRVRWYCFFGWISLWLAIYTLGMSQFQPGTTPPARFVVYQEKQVESNWRVAVDMQAIQQFLDELGGPTIDRQHLHISTQPVPWYLALVGFTGMTNPFWGIELNVDPKLTEENQIQLYHELIHFAHFAHPWQAPAWFCVWLLIAPAFYFLWLVPLCLKFQAITRCDRLWRGLELALLAYLFLWMVPYFLDPEELYAYHFSNAGWGQGAPPLMSDRLGENDLPIVTKSGELAWSELAAKAQIRPLFTSLPLLWFAQHASNNILFWAWLCWGVMVLRRRRHPRPEWLVGALWVLVGLLTIYTFQDKVWTPVYDFIETQTTASCRERPSFRNFYLAKDGQAMTNFGRFLYHWEPPAHAATPPKFKPLPIWVDRHGFRSKDGREFTLIFTLVNFGKPKAATLCIEMQNVARQQFCWLDKEHLTDQSLSRKNTRSWASATWRFAKRGHAQMALRIWRDKKDSRPLDVAIRDLKITLLVGDQIYEVPVYGGL